jgi:hypothetical protein
MEEKKIQKFFNKFIYHKMNFLFLFFIKEKITTIN